MTVGAWEGETETGGLKTCPRCGAKLFADMDVCYGCLYDFTKEVRRPPEVEAVDPAGVTSVPLDEPFSAAGGENGTSSVSEAVRQPGGRNAAAAPGEMGERRSPIRSRKCGGCETESSGVSFSAPARVFPTALGDVGAAADGQSGPALGKETKSLEPVASLARPTHVCIVMGSLAMGIGVPEEGLTLGRDRSCDLVLDCPSVSPRQLAIRREDDGLCAQDLGASNPVLLNGWALSGACSLRVGDKLEVRGSGLSIYPISSIGPGGALS